MTKTHCFWRPFNFFLSMLKLIAKSLHSREYLKCPVLILRPYRESSLKFEFRSPNSQVPPFLSLWHPQVFRAALTPPGSLFQNSDDSKNVCGCWEFFLEPLLKANNRIVLRQLIGKPLIYRVKSCTKGPFNTHLNCSYPLHKTKVTLGQLSEIAQKKTKNKLKERCF